MSSENTTPDTTEYAIEVTGLGKCYQIYDKPSDRLKQMLVRGRKQYFKEFWALKDVSFKIKKGETVGIIGRNGSGKSTLLQMICGTLNPTEGEVKVNGRVAALLELGAGFNPEFSGVENVYMAASLYGLSKEEVDQRFNAIATFADIGDHIHQPVKTYSSGMYVRLAFAVIAHVDADILVVDEALAVGDAFFTQKCMRYLRKFMEKGTVLFVSHDTGAVINLCNHAIWLHHGIAKLAGLPKEVSEQYLAAQYQAIQGDISTSINKTDTPLNSVSQDYHDMRRDFINKTSLRNDIEVFKFSSDAASFGKGGATVKLVELLDQNNKPLLWVVGGERTQLLVHCKANTDLTSPIVGFLVNDRLGQNLFGDNTFITYSQVPLSVAAEEVFVTRFEFRMPILPAGDYSITVAVAEGTQQEHIQNHWIHDALILKSHSSSVSTGLVGIPMFNIEMKVK
ncbi:MAG: ABC transporter ATP-binding protein [Limnohabitans sp.]|uniref:ABC transporter ATP-binding protein n=1 Tax=Limnohabitans sp. TaxID=1907725 RepID=UPI003C78C64F